MFWHCSTEVQNLLALYYSTIECSCTAIFKAEGSGTVIFKKDFSDIAVFKYRMVW